MATIRYSFRPSLFTGERTVVLDNAGIVVQQDGQPDRRVAWSAITAVHIEPATSGDDNRTRFLINLAARDGWRFAIDSVYVRGPAEFEHQTDGFLAVMKAIHQALEDRKDIDFRFGTKRGVLVAWRIALVFVVLAGLFGIVAGIVSEDYLGLLYGGVFVAFGGAGFLLLKGRGGPRRYDPKGMADAADEDPSPAA
jgi:hypothetical protein